MNRILKLFSLSSLLFSGFSMNQKQYSEKKYSVLSNNYDYILSYDSPKWKEGIISHSYNLEIPSSSISNKNVRIIGKLSEPVQVTTGQTQVRIIKTKGISDYSHFVFLNKISSNVFLNETAFNSLKYMCGFISIDDVTSSTSKPQNVLNTYDDDFPNIYTPGISTINDVLNLQLPKINGSTYAYLGLVGTVVTFSVSIKENAYYWWGTKIENSYIYNCMAVYDSHISLCFTDGTYVELI